MPSLTSFKQWFFLLVLRCCVSGEQLDSRAEGGDAVAFALPAPERS